MLFHSYRGATTMQMSVSMLCLFVLAGIVTRVTCMDTGKVFDLVNQTLTHRVPGCPNGFVRHGRSCYLFSTDIESWTGAFIMCRNFGAALVEINDAYEQAYLQAQLRTGRFWIGLSDAQEEKTWMWMKSHQKATYTNWHPGQPDNSHNEDCAEFWAHKKGKWNDRQCHLATTRYICEAAHW